MVYKLKIYVKGLRKIDLVCDEEFFKEIREDLENENIKFLDVNNNIIIPKDMIKKILVKNIEK